MGNRNSTADAWDSSDEGGSDYEHKYDFHRSVLHKSPHDGFESDYDDDEEYFPPSVARKGQQNLQENSSSSAAPHQVTDCGDASAKEPGTSQESCSASGDNAAAHPGAQSTTAGTSNQSAPVTVASSSPQELTKPPNVANKNAGNAAPPRVEGVQNSVIPASVQPQASRASVNNSTSSSGAVKLPEKTQKPDDVGDVYETAGEGAVDDASDDDSLSTITPPRIARPQSDSEYSIDMESESEEASEEEEEGSSEEAEEYESVVEESFVTRTRCSTRTSNRNRNSASDQSLRYSVTPSPPSRQRRLPQRAGLSPDSYRQTRKRQLSPAAKSSSKRTEVPRKRLRQITPAAGTPMPSPSNRYGYISSDSESETEKVVVQRRSPRTSKQVEPSKSPREATSLSARTIRHAAKRAASQFVKTSRKILRDAKSAAKLLRDSASKRRSSAVDDEIEMVTMAKQSSTSKRGRRSFEERRDDGSSENDAGSRVTTRSRGKGQKRKASSPEESPTSVEARMLKQSSRGTRYGEARQLDYLQTDTDHDRERNSVPEVRKNGGLLRKFSRGNTDTPGMQPSHRAPGLPAAASGSGAQTNHQPQERPASVPENITTRTNPFQNVHLVPVSSSHENISLTGSIDSITPELDPSVQPPGQGSLHYTNPFSTFLQQSDSNAAETPQPVSFTSGSVWARVNMRTNQQQVQQPQVQKPQQVRQSPVPGPSGQGMATRSSSQAADTSQVATVNSSRRLNSSLTLTGQFAQSGRFAFLLEDVLQVTVSTGDITMATTNAIVISTDPHLQHQTPLARSVATAAGPDFARACQDFLRGSRNGLQACEVLDTPAGGHLPPVTSHVLHVIIPGASNSRDSEFGKQRKLLLCTYLNCLKHASKKLHLQTVAFPLIGAGTYPADECLHVFFDSLLIYLAERTTTSPLHGIQLIANNPAIARFAAEVLESRMEAIMVSGIDPAMAEAFKDYFGIPDYSRPPTPKPSLATTLRNWFGKPAVKRRRL